jgi:hypothetical protein
VNLPFTCSNIAAAPAHRVYDIAELVVPIRIPNYLVKDIINIAEGEIKGSG